MLQLQLKTAAANAKAAAAHSLHSQFNPPPPPPCTTPPSPLPPANVGERGATQVTEERCVGYLFF